MNDASNGSTKIARRRFLTAAIAVAGMSRLRPLSADPGVMKRLRSISTEPLVGESDPADLISSRVTNLDRFFVRCNGNVPEIEGAKHVVSVEGLVDHPRMLSMDELRALPKRSIEAVLMCAGNRRTEFYAEKKVSGTPWGPGGIGNAVWSGASLADVLNAAGIQAGAKHVWFEGVDQVTEKDKSVAPYGGSIPLERALAGDVLLAYEMNDRALLKEHGSPIRVFVPGVIGARSVKWLRTIRVSDREAPYASVQKSYKIVKTTDAAELASATPIYEYSVNGYICSPTSENKLTVGKIRFSGYALPSGAKNAVVKSAVLIDAAGRRHEARLLGEAKPNSWQLWEAEIELAAGEHRLTLCVEDSSGAIQPEKANWNALGYLYNARHSIAVRVG